MTDIPTLGLPHEMPAIRNSDDLCLCWRALMGPLGFSWPRLWFAFLEPDNMMTAPLTQIEDIPRTADSRLCVSLLEMCRHVVGRNGAGGSVPMLLTGPGRNPKTTQIAVGLAASPQRQTISVSRCGRYISRMTSS